MWPTGDRAVHDPGHEDIVQATWANGESQKVRLCEEGAEVVGLGMPSGDVQAFPVDIQAHDGKASLCQREGLAPPTGSQHQDGSRLYPVVCEYRCFPALQRPFVPALGCTSCGVVVAAIVVGADEFDHFLWRQQCREDSGEELLNPKQDPRELFAEKDEHAEDASNEAQGLNSLCAKRASTGDVMRHIVVELLRDEVRGLSCSGWSRWRQCGEWRDQGLL